jgi:hypothetical protein
MKSSEQTTPRAREEGLLVQELADELLVYDRIRHKAHCLNETAALIWNNCDGKTSVSQMTRLLEKHANAPVDEAMVWLAFDELGKAKLLQDNNHPLTSEISRRELMRRIGTAAVIALPVVSSIVAPHAVEAATCLGSGQGCTSSAQCCSFVCSGGTCS